MGHDTATVLREHGIQPSAQRIAIAEYILTTDSHPSADQVHDAVKQRLPMVSRATVYNTLNLFVARGLVAQLAIAAGHVVFDPLTHPHHHFIDDDSGRIYDVNWDSVRVDGIEQLRGFDVRDFQVVMHGKKQRKR